MEEQEGQMSALTNEGGLKVEFGIKVKGIIKEAAEPWYPKILKL